MFGIAWLCVWVRFAMVMLCWISSLGCYGEFVCCVWFKFVFGLDGFLG